MRVLVACLLLFAAVPPASSQTWTNVAGGNWSVAGNWNPVAVPASGTATQLAFPNDGGVGYTATNDLVGPFVLNRITVTSDVSAGFAAAISSVIVANAATTSLSFQGATPSITMAAAGNAQLNTASVSAPAGLLLDGGGFGALTIGSALTGSGALTIARSAYTPGAPSVLLSNTLNVIGSVTLQGGTLQLANAAAIGSTTSTLTVSTPGAGFAATGELRSSANLTLTNPVAITSGATLNLGQGNAFAMTFAGGLTGAGGVQVGSPMLAGTANIGSAATYTGSTTVFGILRLNGTGTIAPNGPITIQRGGVLELNNTAVVPNRLQGAVTLAMNRASFNVIANAGGNAVESIDTVNGTGENVFQLTPASGGGIALGITNLNRGFRGTTFFGFSGASGSLGGTPGGNVANVAMTNINSAPAANALVGTGGTATALRIVPFFLSDTTPGGSGNSFVTLDANGVRPLNLTTEYAASLPLANYRATTGNNVRLTTSANLAVPTTVNSLVLGAANAGVFGLDGASGSLTVTSGAVLGSSGSPTHLAVGTLNFGAAEGHVYASTTPVLVNSVVTGSGGLTVSSGSSGTLNETRLLNPANTFSGPLTVNFGALTYMQDGALGAAANSATISGGALRYAGFADTLSRNLTVTPAGGAIQVTVTGSPTAGPGGMLTLTGILQGTGPLTFNGDGGTGVAGAGEIRLQGTAPNFAGLPVLSGGILKLDSDARLGISPQMVLNGGTLYPTASYSSGRTYSVAGNTEIRTDAGTSLTLTGELRGGPVASSLTKTGPGTLRLEAANSYGGSTNLGFAGTSQLPGGDLVLAAGGALLRSTSLNVNDAGRLILDNTGVNLANRVNNGQVLLAGGTLRMLGNAAAASGETFGALSLGTETGSAIDLVPGGSQPATVTFANSTAGGNPLTRNAGGTLVVSGPNLGTQSLVNFAFQSAPPVLTNNVLPGVFGVNGTTPTMVTAPSAAGTATVRPLNAGEIVTTFAGTNFASNVSLAAPETIGSQNVNSLNLVGGSVTVTAGSTLTLTSGNLIATPTATVIGGSLAGTSGEVHVYTAGLATDVVPLNSVLTSFRLNKVGPAVLELQAVNTASTYNVQAGTLRLGGAGVIPTTASVRVQGAATFDLNGNSTNIVGLSGLGTVQLGTNPNTRLTVQSGAFGGSIAGSGQVVKTGATTWNLTSTADIPQPIMLSQGTLFFGAASGSVPVAPLVTGGLISMANGTTLSLNPVREFARDVAINVDDNVASVTIDHGGGFGATTTISGNILIGVGKTLNLGGTAQGQTRLTGLISGVGALNIVGSNNLVMNAANTLSGPTTVAVTVGTVALGHDAAFGTGPVTLALAGGTLAAANGDRAVANEVALAGDLPTLGVGRLAFTGNVALAGTGPTRTVTVNSSGGVVLNNLAGGATAVNLAKSGGGSLTLTGTATYSGTTAVNAGTLLVPAGSSVTGTGAVVVGSGGAPPAFLAGGGSLAGPVTVNPSGVLSPGTSPGTLTLGGGVTMTADSTYLWEMSANSTSNPGNDWDRVSTTSAVVSPGAVFLPSFIGTATTPNGIDTFWLGPQTWVDVIQTASTTGPTNFVIDNAAWSAFGAFATLASPGGGVSLQWTPVPEPTHLLALGIVVLALRRRR